VNANSYPEGAERLRDACSRSRNITLVDAVMSSADLARLYVQADVFLSLHRAEGFGLTIADSMLLGTPVIATGWSGNTDFVNSDCGVPIGFQLIPARDPQGTYDFAAMQWANPRIDEAANALRWLRGDQATLRALAIKAKTFAHANFGPETYGRVVRTLLPQVVRSD
jgi:glycosyltransferase involved in cell wall biosynthesis